MNYTKCPLTIGMLTYNSPNTLKHTLISYHTNGLLDLTDDIICIIQPSIKSNEEIDICNTFNINYILEPFNTKMAGGIKRIWENAKYDYVLFLECDFYLTSSKKDTEHLISLSLNYLQSNTFDIVRLRSLKNPGHYMQARKWAITNMNNFLTPELYLLTYILENPQDVFPEQIKKISDDPLIYSMTNKHCVYTNNPHIIHRSFYNNYIKPHIKEGSNLESQIDLTWSFTNNHKIAITSGLFTHNRIDGHTNCLCCPIIYGGMSDICDHGCCPSTIQTISP